jgi:1,4-dihydroxy-2-naphthoate octaprenyltransferase
VSSFITVEDQPDWDAPRKTLICVRLGKRRKKMSVWMILFIALLIAWLGGFTMFHVAGGLIHILLVFALISFVLHFIIGGRTA